MHIILMPAFQQHYENHWQSPSESPIWFVAMLYAIMALALQSYHRANDEPPDYLGKSRETSVAYRRLTAQTLALADIMQPIPQILEVLCLHLQAEYARSQDTETGIIVLLALVIRIAMRMGYHRDPGPHANVPIYQAELRRRLWVVIRILDILISFQYGLPAIVRTDCTDTKLPRNLYDEELTEDMRILPPSRPATEPTSVTYMIVKGNLSYTFARVVERVSSVTEPPSYEEVMDLDAQLRSARNEIPEHLRSRPLSEAAGDPEVLIMQRYGLELLFLKSLCVLHRRFIARGRESARYAYSRKTCVDASMDILAHHITIQQETEPGGRLQTVKWYISSLTNSDFTLAAMIVGLDLHHCAEAERAGRKTSQSPGSTPDVWNQGRREEMMDALRHAVSVWSKRADESIDAYKAASVLGILIQNLVNQSQPSTYPNFTRYTQRNGNYGILPNNNLRFGEDVAPEHSAAMTLGLLSSGGVSPNPTFNTNGATSSSSAETRGYPASMAGLLNEPFPERTGMTPQYSGPDAGVANPLSPFSQLLSANAGGMDGGDIDWVSIRLLGLRYIVADMCIHRAPGIHTFKARSIL